VSAAVVDDVGGTGADEQDLGIDPAVLRAGISLVLSAIAAVLGAFVLGEYQFEGWLPVGAGLLFGLVLGEIVVAIGQVRTFVVASLCGLEAFGGLLWAGWISAGEGIEPIPGGAWLAAVLGLVAGAARVIGRRRRPQTASS
jgi:hypothetical protein